MSALSTGYVLLGSPGAGKGTIGQFLSETYGMDHFSSGDLLRTEVSERTSIGKAIETKIERGEQVSDEMITELVLTRIQRLVKNNKSFILDGFPQTLPQEKALNLFSKSHHINIQYICVNVEPATALERMVHRITCSVCNTIFSKINLKTEECVKCSGKLVVRKSDQTETAKKRLEQFEKTTKQVMEDVQKKIHPLLIDGNNSVEMIRKCLINLIKPA